MLNEIHAGRLLRLADRLEQPMPKKFTWSFRSWFNKLPKDESGDVCGTVGCAIGLASTMQEFIDLGLAIELDRGVGVPLVNGHGHYYTVGWEIFGLKPSEFDHLFMPGYSLSCAATPGEVAANIRRFVAENTEKKETIVQVITDSVPETLPQLDLRLRYDHV